MKITKSQLKQIIKEELESVVQEDPQATKRNPAKLEAAANAVILLQKLQTELTNAANAGRKDGMVTPAPMVTIKGEKVVRWLAKTSGYSLNEIFDAAKSKGY